MKQLQGFASIAQLLPQLVVDNLPEEHKKALLRKLRSVDNTGKKAKELVYSGVHDCNHV